MRKNTYKETDNDTVSVSLYERVHIQRHRQIDCVSPWYEKEHVQNSIQNSQKEEDGEKYNTPTTPLEPTKN